MAKSKSKSKAKATSTVKVSVNVGSKNRYSRPRKGLNLTPALIYHHVPLYIPQFTQPQVPYLPPTPVDTSRTKPVGLEIPPRSESPELPQTRSESPVYPLPLTPREPTPAKKETRFQTPEPSRPSRFRVPETGIDWSGAGQSAMRGIGTVARHVPGAIGAVAGAGASVVKGLYDVLNEPSEYYESPVDQHSPEPVVAPRRGTRAVKPPRTLSPDTKGQEHGESQGGRIAYR